MIFANITIHCICMHQKMRQVCPSWHLQYFSTIQVWAILSKMYSILEFQVPPHSVIVIMSINYTYFEMMLLVWYFTPRFRSTIKGSAVTCAVASTSQPGFPSSSHPKTPLSLQITFQGPPWTPDYYLWF